MTALRAELTRKDQTIDQLELKNRAKEKRMGDLHEQIYQLGVANRDLETENRNLQLDKEHLLERLAENQQYIIDKLHQQVGPDILGEVLDERAAASPSTDAAKGCPTRVSASIFQVIAKPALNNLPLVATGTEIEKLRPFLL